MLYRIALIPKLLLISVLGVMPSAASQWSPLTADAEQALKPGDQFQECYGCPVMVKVPAGSFVMGSPNDEKGRSANEGPQHSVTIAQPLAVGRVTVTVDEWNTCVDDHGCADYRSRSTAPITAVSWEDANAYLAWLSRKTGKSYRLLSEAEFEYAGRAGNTAAYPWGDDAGKNNANCDGCGSAWDGRLPAMGGSFAANAFGLYDMAGNVWEWVEDCYHDDYNGAPADGSAWTSGDCSARVVRGGSWRIPAQFMRSASRVKFASARSSEVGFRAARTLTPGVAEARGADLVTPTAGTAVAQRPQQPKPKDTFKDCAICPEMIVAPAGSFTMGSPATEAGHDDKESPQHTVTIAKPFAVGRYAITFDEWDACVADKGCNFIRPPDQGWGRGRRPAINVSWDDAKLYVAWLSKKTGKPYRLLSEAEREYVTRAGTSSPFWTGELISKTQANYDDYDHGKTVPVDSFTPNPWGLYQVHGNVSEWVEDCNHVHYKTAPPDGSAYVIDDFNGDCKKRVYRGGSWGSDQRSLRSANREWAYPDTRDKFTGFRVASGL